MDHQPHCHEDYSHHEKLSEYKVTYAPKQSLHSTHESQKIAEYIVECIIQSCSQRLTTDAFEYLLNRRELTTKQDDHGHKLRVMSYNILAESLASHTATDFKPFDLKYLDWNHRSKSIFKEIAFYSPDILCLQELDRNDKLLMPSLEKMEYQYVSKMRTGDKNDGLGIVWKKSRFELVEYKYIEFNLNGASHPLLDRDNIAIFTVLQIKSQEPSLSERLVIVANFHALFNDRRGEIKITQVYLTLKVIKALCIKYEKYSKMIFLGGDFNTIPNSALYQWLSSGNFNFADIRASLISGQAKAFWSGLKLFPSFKDYLIANINCFKYDDTQRENRLDTLMKWMMMLRQLKVHVDAEDQVKIVIVNQQEDASEKKDPSKFDFTIPTPIHHLKSAYGSFQRYYYKHTVDHLPPPTVFKNYSTFESLCTTITKNGAATVDYIWYTECPPSSHPHLHHKLKVIRVSETPLAEDILSLGKMLPHKFFPSDHFSLIVDFMFDS